MLRAKHQSIPSDTGFKIHDYICAIAQVKLIASRSAIDPVVSRSANEDVVSR